MADKTVFKKTILGAAFAAGALALSLPQGAAAAGCDLHVINTLYPSHDFVKEIGGEAVCSKLLLKPGQEAHTYEPSPRDIREIAASDLLVYNGGDNSEWVESMLKSLGKKAPKAVAMTDMVPVVEETLVEGMEDDDDHDHDHDADEAKDHDHDHDHDHDGDEAKDHDHDHDADKDDDDDKEIDEHVWLSPKNAVLIVQGLTKELSELDPKKAPEFKARSEAYIAKLEALDREYKAVIDSSKKKTLVFGDRFPFRYLTDAYGLKYYAAFPGCSAQVQASAKTLAFLTDKARDLKTPVVLEIERSNGRIAHTVAKPCGAKVMTLHSIHNLSPEEIKNGETYLSLMKKNLEVLKRALN